MAYWPIVPLALAVALLTAAYATRPRVRSHRLFAAYLSCTILNTGALLLLANANTQAQARWLASLRYWIAYPLSDLFFWLLVVDLLVGDHELPFWVHVVTAASILLHGVVAVIATFDLAGSTTVFYRDLVGLTGGGYALSHGALHLVPQLARLLPLGGAWAGLILHFWRQDRQRQVFTGAGLLLAILLPLITHLVTTRTARSFVGLGGFGEMTLVLVLGYVAFRARFAAVLLASSRLLADSAAGNTRGWVVLDTAGNVLHANAAALRILGIEARSLHYAPYTALLATRSLPADVRENLSYAIAVHPAPYETEVVMDSATAPLYARMRIVPIRDAMGRTVGKTISLTETTLLRRCQDQLNRTQRARSMLETALNSVWGPVVDLGNGVLVVPIAGQLPSTRTEQLVSGLMDTVRTHQARVVLIDVHALPALSPDSAKHLLHGLEAVSLLGAQVGWVGVQPAVAQVLGALDIAVDQLHIYPDLPTALTIHAPR